MDNLSSRKAITRMVEEVSKQEKQKAAEGLQKAKLYIEQKTKAEEEKKRKDDEIKKRQEQQKQEEENAKRKHKENEEQRQRAAEQGTSLQTYYVRLK
jgi:hypothetical protein